MFAQHVDQPVTGLDRLEPHVGEQERGDEDPEKGEQFRQLAAE